MSAVTRPRGPLPPRVYWTRRCLVLVLALLLVLGISRLLGGGGSGTGPTARQVGATASTSSTPTSSAPTSSATPAAPAATGSAKSRATATSTATPTGTPTTTPGATGTAGGKAGTSSSATPLAQPTGPCSASDIVATPSVKGTAYAGRPVVFRLALTTKQSPACTWNVSPQAVVVKVTSGSDRVWSTQQCRAAVPRQAVVVRNDHPATVRVTWDGQRSDATCTRSTAWAEPGFYHVVAAAFGSDPADEQFQLLTPPAPTVTKTPKPRQKGTGNGRSGGARSGGAHT